MIVSHQQHANLNIYGQSPVAIFNVDTNRSAKQMPRLGTLPEFGDSHSLTPTQFYEKLNARYNSNATDKAYLNYLFKSMGYSNGWADAQPYMFSDEVLPVGMRGLRVWVSNITITTQSCQRLTGIAKRSAFKVQMDLWSTS